MDPSKTNQPEQSEKPVKKTETAETKENTEVVEQKIVERPSVSFESLEEHKKLTSIVWGNNIKQDLFDRWSQGGCFTKGFIFDAKKEPTALLQFQGGPCAVISAVQAFLLRELLVCAKCGENWRKTDELDRHFADGLLSTFINVASEGMKYLIFHTNSNNKHEPRSADEESGTSIVESGQSSSKPCTAPSPKRIKLDYDAFTSNLVVYKFETLNELKAVLYERIGDYKRDFGVLCFLYSLLLTKRLDILERELEESGESLIDSLHGHGSQCLTNFLLCGIATSNVFDGDKSLEGLQLRGIPKQSTIGFLTIMEYLRYCEVGWNLKNPTTPIWLLASETHLTVFFSREPNLIQKNETDRQIALRNFQKFDPFDNGFVKTEDLELLMESLELLTDKEYVDVVKQQLDTENLGIITQTAFLNEFYPQSEPTYIPDTFTVYHYNGLVRQMQDNEVQYAVGKAKIIDFTDQPSLDINSIKNCLQTKWPTIEIVWADAKPPSLN